MNLSTSVVKQMVKRMLGRTTPPPPAGTALYQGRVKRRSLDLATIPPAVNIAAFAGPLYQAINEARLAHLDTLGLPLAGKSVLDVGAGTGDLAQFFVQKGCQVTCVDGRKENIDELCARFPKLRGHVGDVQVDSLEPLGKFDIVFCYGLLYHVENPLAALRNMAAVCSDLMLLEMIICANTSPVRSLADEKVEATQALLGMGSRPSPSYIAMALDRIGFPYVYLPVEPPDHPQFKFRWMNNLEWNRDGNNMRCIFVASRSRLTNPRLVDLLVD
jgi:2-polyprenyl-3-methyl-5-hydroxy-6-metoxy-1,4-benzoquinol methylase